MPYAVKLLITALAGYLIGACPTSLLVGKIFYHLDLRQQGSGNLGATNAFRVLGAKAGAAVLVIDFCKGVIPVLIARWLMPGHSGWLSWLMLAAALSAICGHAFSPYIGFRGGKGVATTAGAMLALVPQVFAAEAVCFIAILLLTRYMSVTSIAAALLFPVWTLILDPQPPFLILSTAAAVFVIWLHRVNIGRLRRGSEPRFSFANRGQGKQTQDTERDTTP